MANNLSIIVVFNSKNHAFHLEKHLKNNDYKPILYNAPSYLAKSCSMAIKINESAYDFILKKITSDKLDVYRIYKICYENSEKIYKVLKKYK